VTDFVTIQLFPGGSQIIPDEQRFLAFGTKGLNFISIEEVTAVTALKVGNS
jgi:hypothetical protein